MKSVLIIGMGRFAHHLCQNLSRLGNEIMIVDQDENQLQDLLPYVTGAQIGDCTNPEVLRGLGVSNYDICFVCTGSNFQSSLEITSLLKEQGAKYVVSKAVRELQAKFLLRNGADEVIYPERDSAERAATKYSLDNIYDYIELPGEYSFFEMRIPESWDNKSIIELELRTRHGINVIGVRAGNGLHMMPRPDYKLKREDHLMVVGRDADIEKVLKMK